MPRAEPAVAPQVRVHWEIVGHDPVSMERPGQRGVLEEMLRVVMIVPVRLEVACLFPLGHFLAYQAKMRKADVFCSAAFQKSRVQLLSVWPLRWTCGAEGSTHSRGVCPNGARGNTWLPDTGPHPTLWSQNRCGSPTRGAGRGQKHFALWWVFAEALRCAQCAAQWGEPAVGAGAMSAFTGCRATPAPPSTATPSLRGRQTPAPCQDLPHQ